MLLEHGAEPETEALILSVCIKNLDLCKALVERGADVNAKGNYGKTALDHAKESDLWDFIEYLKAHGAK